MKITFPLFLSAILALSVPAVAQTQKIITIAGTGISGYNGDGISAITARVSSPSGVAVDASGNVYVQDFLNHRVRKINTSGYITTIAGNGTVGYSGDGSVGTTSQVSPFGIAADKHGNVYISDASYGVIRKVNTVGIISTFAGSGVQGNSGNGGPALSAKLDGVYGMAVDTAGNVYVADGKSNVVRMINAAGIITTVAGNDTAGFAGDNFPATDARLDSPYAVAADRRGNLYISDMKNNVIRKVDAAGIITTYAGTGAHGYSGNGGPAVLADLDRPAGIAVDTIGNLYIADADNDVIRKVDTFGVITTVAGNGTPGFGGDLNTVDGANLHTPFGVAVDRYGSLYIADANNQRVRKTYTPVGVADVANNTAVTVYPNPAEDRFAVSGLIKADKVCIYDLVGKQVSATWDATADGIQTFAIGDLATGVYMLQVTDNAGAKKAVVKLIKE